MKYYAGYINLDHRQDRLTHIKRELSKAGIEAERIPGRLPETFDLEDKKYEVMKARTPGAIGCHYSQVKVMENGLEKGMNAMVLEDDCIFCSDFRERMVIIDDFLKDREWDVFWLGGTYHLAPIWHGAGHPNQEMNGHCDCTLNRDWEETDNPHIRRVYGAWSTYAYIVNIKSLPKVLEMLEENVSTSIGIDWLFMKLAPKMYQYIFNPGMVRQRDMKSDIGNGVTQFSRFQTLGPHWFKDRM